MNALEQLAVADGIGDAIKCDQLLGLPARRGKVDIGRYRAAPGAQLRQVADHFIGFIDSRLRLGGSGLWASTQPFNLGMHTISERILSLSLCMEVVLLPLEKRTVVSLDAQKSIGVGTIE